MRAIGWSLLLLLPGLLTLPTAAAAPSPNALSRPSSENDVDPGATQLLEFRFRNDGSDATSWSHFTFSFDDLSVVGTEWPSGWTARTYSPGETVGGCDGQQHPVEHVMVEVSGAFPAGATHTFRITIRAPDDGDESAWLRARLTLMERNDWSGPYHRWPTTGAIRDQQECRAVKIGFNVRPPAPSNTPPGCAPLSGPGSATAGQQVAYEVQCSDDQGHGFLVWSVNGAERERETLRGMSGVVRDTFAPTFTSAGTYTVAAHAEDAQGARSETVQWTTTVAAANVAPTCAKKSGPERVAAGAREAWQVECHDAEGHAAIVWILDGAQAERESAVGMSGTLADSFAATLASTGAHAIEAYAIDAGGLESARVAWYVTAYAPEQDAHGALVARPQLAGVSGPDNETTPGAQLTLSLDYQVWSASACPGCIRQLVVRAGDEAVCAYEGAPGAHPGASGRADVRFRAPTAPGRYHVSWVHAAESSCAAARAGFDNGWDGKAPRVISSFVVIAPARDEPPVCTAVSGPSVLRPGEEATFRARCTDDRGVARISWVRDNAAYTVDSLGGAAPFSPAESSTTSAYSEPGAYVMEAYATDSAGQQGAPARFELRVSGGAPTLTLASDPAAPTAGDPFRLKARVVTPDGAAVQGARVSFLDDARANLSSATTDASGVAWSEPIRRAQAGAHRFIAVHDPSAAWGHAEATATVQVAAPARQGTPRVLVVAPGESGYARFFAGATVETSATLPASLAPYSVVVVSSYDVGRAEADALRAYVAAGGSVLLESGVPYKLCGYDVGGCLPWWGAAARYHNLGTGASASIVADSPFGTSLRAGDCLVRATRGPGAAALSGVGAELVARWNDGTAALTRAEPGTGRVAYLAGEFSASAEACQDNARALIGGLAAWLLRAPPPAAPAPGCLPAADWIVFSSGNAEARCANGVTELHARAGGAVACPRGTAVNDADVEVITRATRGPGVSATFRAAGTDSAYATDASFGFSDGVRACKNLWNLGNAVFLSTNAFGPERDARKMRLWVLVDGKAQSALVDVADESAWHEYKLVWLADRAMVYVDGTLAATVAAKTPGGALPFAARASAWATTGGPVVERMGDVAFAPATAPPAEARPDFTYRSDFGSLAPGAYPTGWQNLFSGTAGAIREVDGRRALLLEASGTWGRADGLPVPPRDHWVVGVDVAPQWSGGRYDGGAITFYEKTDCCNGKAWGGTRLTKDGAIEVGANRTPIAKGAWTHVDLAFDAKRGTYSAWVCGKPLALDAPLPANVAYQTFAFDLGWEWKVAFDNVTLLGTDDRARFDAARGPKGTCASAPAEVPLPRVAAITPASATVGTRIRIDGENLTETTRVEFAGGASATPASREATRLEVVVPPGARTGPLAVVTPHGRATSPGAFTLLEPKPDLVAEMTLAGGALVGDKPFVVRLGVRNAAAGATGAFAATLYVDGRAERTWNVERLETAWASDHTLRLAAGRHELRFVVDERAVVADADRSNNEARLAETWAAAPTKLVSDILVDVDGLRVELEADIAGGKAPYVATWQFADGQTATGLRTARTFPSPGTQRILLHVRDADGQEHKSSREVSLVNEGTEEDGGTGYFLIHGICSTESTLWRVPGAPGLKIHDALAEHGPVHTANYAPPGTPAEMLGRLETQLEQFRRDSGVSSVVVVGHSLGGIMARALLLREGGSAIERVVTLDTPDLGRDLGWSTRQVDNIPTCDRAWSTWVRDHLNSDASGSAWIDDVRAGTRDDDRVLRALYVVCRWELPASCDDGNLVVDRNAADWNDAILLTTYPQSGAAEPAKRARVQEAMCEEGAAASVVEGVDRVGLYHSWGTDAFANVALALAIAGDDGLDALDHVLRCEDAPRGRAPVITVISPAKRVPASPGEEVPFTARCDDPDGDAVAIVWSLPGRNRRSEHAPGASWRATERIAFDVGSHGVSARCVDAAGTEGNEVDWTILVEKPQNRAPTTQRAKPAVSSVTAKVGDSRAFEVACADPDEGDDLASRWSLAGPSKETRGPNDRDILGQRGNDEEEFFFPRAGKYTLDAWCEDETGAKSRAVRWTIETSDKDSAAPVIVRAETTTKGPLLPQRSVSFYVEATDADGDIADIRIRTDASLFGAGGWEVCQWACGKQKARWTTEFPAPGTYTVTAIVKDRSGLSAETQWRVEVAAPTSAAGPQLASATPMRATVEGRIGEPMALAIDATDVDGDIEGITFSTSTSTLKGGSKSDGCQIACGRHEHEWRFTPTKAGRFKVSAVVLDKQGNRLTHEWEVVVTAATYALTVSTKEPGAEIRLDGVVKGVTDKQGKLVIPDVPHGRHTVEAKLGAKIATEELNVEKDRTVKLTLRARR